ncbi:MAG: tetratricopeptide repeat protein [Deltaproteobacteria bacterium]|nr:MAG: tetratricopeptide repeat protein [Deltaproteobacteria bacterium]
MGIHPIWAAGNLGKSEIAFSKGLLLFNDGKLDQAREQFLKTMSLNPENASASYFAGMTYFQKEEYSKAITYFDQSIAKDSQVSEPHFYKAVSLYRLGRRENSLPEFEKTESLSHSGALYDLAKSYRRSMTQPVANADEASGQSAPNKEEKDGSPMEV